MRTKLKQICSLDRLENPLVLSIVGILLGLSIALPTNALVDHYLPDALQFLLSFVLGLTCTVTAMAVLIVITTERKAKREFIEDMSMIRAISRRQQEAPRNEENQ